MKQIPGKRKAAVQKLISDKIQCKPSNINGDKGDYLVIKEQYISI